MSFGVCECMCVGGGGGCEGGCAGAGACIRLDVGTSGHVY